MRNLRKNTVEMWYALYEDEVVKTDISGDETGDPIVIYGSPVFFKANMSPGIGKAQREMFGTDVDMEKTISTTELTLPITENSLIWKETPPLRKKDGSVDLNSADYEVSGKPIVGLNVMVIPLKARAKDG